MHILSETQQGINWLAQFRALDQGIARKLLDSLDIVSHNVFLQELRDLIVSSVNQIDGNVGLFAEREVRRGKWGIPHRLYKEPGTKRNRRAFGMGPQPVQPKNNYDLNVGSEGIIAWLVSDVCRENPRKFISHPSPDQIRERRIRKFVLVTDLVGSGRRASEYLDSAWKSASVKSWSSFKLLDFEVVAYTATVTGQQRVKQHRCKPALRIVKSCPTISSEFKNELVDTVRSLCIRYDPINSDSVESLGYKGSEALLVFSHGCPNNVPRIFHAKPNRNPSSWEPLFPKRGTASTRDIFEHIDTESMLRRKLENLHETRLSSGGWIRSRSPECVKMLVILASLQRGKGSSDVVSRKTGLAIPEIDIYLEKAISWGWLTERRRLTSEGRGQLKHARKASSEKTNIDKEEKPYYFPKSLRTPVVTSSQR